MLIYLLNASIIWLSCLFCYELLFKKETFYRLNRLYLLASLAAGIVLPMLPVGSWLPQATAGLPRPLHMAEVRHIGLVTTDRIVALNGNRMVEAHPVDLATIAWIVYCTGVGIGFLLVALEARRIVSLYRNGRMTPDEGCLIVETHTPHSPFSFFRLIFVSTKQQYDHTQWSMLMLHEREHIRRLHSVDNLVLITLRILLWFHPLVHIYYKKLRMVHEFQADAAGREDVCIYGNFLLEESMLQHRMSLSHSFNHSPIKNRLAMLTKKKSGRVKMLKYATVMPLSLLLVFCCTDNPVSGRIAANSGKTYFKGNEIQFGKLKIIPFSYREQLKQQNAMLTYQALPDSIPTKDFVTGVPKMEAVQSEMMPVAINGKPVLGNEPKYFLTDNEKNFTAPLLGIGFKDIEQYIFAQLQPQLNKLENGEYNFNIERVVLNDQGKVAYYEANGISVYTAPYEKERIIERSLKQAIDERVKNVLETSPAFRPAIKDGKAVNVRLTTGNYDIIVKNHQARLVERKGC